MERRGIVLLMVLVFAVETIFSQRTVAPKDTTPLYKKIEYFSNRSKFTKFAYGYFFKGYSVKPRKKNPIQKPYKDFVGKTIRRIIIVSLDPFGNSIADTVGVKLSLLSRTGNALHLKTQNQTIQNLMLIRPKQKFDSLLVMESERLVRSRPYIRDVHFYIRTVSARNDSVDITIRSLDKWSLLPDLETSNTDYTVSLTDQNFLGMGHEFLNGVSRNLPRALNTYRTNYIIPNISNTYISVALHYEIDGIGNFNKSFIIDRPFYSSFAKWAGGVSLNDIQDKTNPLNFRANTQDYWIGQAQKLSIGNALEKRLTNFITTTRYLRVRYLDKPLEQYDPLHYFSDQDFFLTGIGISTQTYVQDRFLFNYGITEDVPVGKVLAFTGGFQVKKNLNRTFVGARFSEGNYYPWGYLSSNIEYETFFRGSSAEEGIFGADVKAFTELFVVGKWKFRQFITPEIKIGIHRFAYDSLTLNSGFGIDGFKSTKLSGSSRFLLSLQTQAYAPWDFIGFRFGPFFTCSLGMLGTPADGFRKSKVYSQFGIGVLIKNENLIMNTFQFSFSFFPEMPGNGQNVLKLNSFKTSDFGFSNFEMGKPGARVFQ